MRGTNGGDWLSQFLVPPSQTRWLRSIVPLGASLLVHALLAVPLVLISFLPRAEAKQPYDAWAGDTFEVAMAGDLPASARGVGGEVALAQPSQPEQAPEAPAPEAAEEPPAAAPLAADDATEEEEAERAKLAQRAKAEAKRKRAHRRRRQHRKSMEKSASAEKPRSESADEAPPKPGASAGEGEDERSAEREGEHDGAGSDKTGSGNMGAAGLPVGVRALPTAFTRVLPRAAVGDAKLLKHGPGDLGEIRFTLHLDSAGKIERAEYSDVPDARLKALIERTLRFLGKGQFALNENPGQDLSGTQKVSVHLELKQTAATPDTDDPMATRSLGFMPPPRSGKRVGSGYFELESGLRLDAVVVFE
ncbi:MAG: hypothetical protein AB7K71_13180 [Polyangiaceae bacterium]